MATPAPSPCAHRRSGQMDSTLQGFATNFVAHRGQEHLVYAFAVWNADGEGDEDGPLPVVSQIVRALPADAAREAGMEGGKRSTSVGRKQHPAVHRVVLEEAPQPGEAAHTSKMNAISVMTGCMDALNQASTMPTAASDQEVAAAIATVRAQVIEATTALMKQCHGAVMRSASSTTERRQRVPLGASRTKRRASSDSSAPDAPSRRRLASGKRHEPDEPDPAPASNDESETEGASEARYFD